jgi:hypothetical protein
VRDALYIAMDSVDVILRGMLVKYLKGNCAVFEEYNLLYCI